MGENPRMRATFAFNELLLMKFTDRPTLGAHYWTNNAFWFADEAGSTLQVDSWQKSYDQLIRAFEGFPWLESRCRSTAHRLRRKAGES